ncbi:MAG: histone deacetylase family protein [Caldilineaceae bacterium]|nr:histone deacetylase family protein [Caldilineaceae bacterium]
MLATVYSDTQRAHNTAGVRLEGHPYIIDEVPARAEILLQAVRAAALGPVVAPDDFGLAPILAAHTAEYVDHLQTVYAATAAIDGQAGPVLGNTFAPRGALRKPASVLGLTGYYSYGVGSPVLAGTWAAAYAAAQCALTAAARVKAGERAAYALCRPPGHHAAADLYGGYCYLNNAAIAARWLAQTTRSRVAILDIDYHHGNGTQMIFYRDPGVLTCSLHAHPDDDYPWFWGAADERGDGPGLGFNHNWTLPQNTGDEPYLAALAAALGIIASNDPAWLVVSAGFDIAVGDPVGGFAITPAGLAAIGAQIASLGVPTIIAQEGGYLLDRLGANALAFLGAFA